LNRGTASVDVSDHDLVQHRQDFTGKSIHGSPLTADPLLGPLQANGGLTATRLPRFVSPVVDAGGSPCRAQDQRGVRRPQLNACDIGAVEFNPSARIIAHPGKRIETRKRRVRVSFAFRSDDQHARFECQLDRGRFEPCTSPKTYRVGHGKHAFEVRTRRERGALKTRTASFRFRVV